MKRAWETDKNRRTTAIIRVSSKRQEDNTSQEVQEREIRTYCQRNNLKLIKVFPITESAKKSIDRKQYRAATEYGAANGCMHEVYYQQDREARNLTDTEQREGAVREGSVIIHYVKDAKVYDLDTPESDFMMRDIQGVINKQYSRVLSGKVQDAQRNKARNGWFPGGKPPMGYRHERPKDDEGREMKRAPTTIVHAPYEEVEQVRRIFELRAKGHSLKYIRTQVISEGYVDEKKQKGFRKNAVEWILKNKFYHGRFDWDGDEYEGKHPLIIPKVHLKAVKISFETLSRGKGDNIEDAVFSGWLRCADSDCNRQILYEPKKKVLKSTGEAKIYHLYRCSNSREVHKSLKGLYVSEEKLWEQFSPAVEDITISHEMAKQISEALNVLHKKSQAKTKTEMVEFRSSIEAARDQEDVAYQHFVDGVLDQEGYQARIKRLRRTQDRYANLLEQAQLSISDAWQETVSSILELAINAKSLWNTAGKLERVNMLKEVCSNQVLDGTTLRYDLRKPFKVLANIKKKDGFEDWSG